MRITAAKEMTQSFRTTSTLKKKDVPKVGVKTTEPKCVAYNI